MAAGPLLLRIALIAGLIVSTGGLASGTAPQPLELAVKATFLPKFLAYVGWPPTGALPTRDAIQICVIGRDPFGPKLDGAIAGQHIEQHPLAVRRLPTTDGAAGCRLAFIGGSPNQTAAAALKALHGTPVLTVTDARLGPTRGIVHFDLKGGRVGFHIDDEGAASSDLAISSRLLNLALTVRPREKQR